MVDPLLYTERRALKHVGEALKQLQLLWMHQGLIFRVPLHCQHESFAGALQGFHHAVSRVGSANQ